MSCVSVGFGLLANVQTPSEKKKKKNNKLWGQEADWIECQRLCSGSVDWLQSEVNLKLKWNWWSRLGRQEVITNLWPHTDRHHGRRQNHTHVAFTELQQDTYQHNWDPFSSLSRRQKTLSLLPAVKRTYIIVTRLDFLLPRIQINIINVWINFMVGRKHPICLSSTSHLSVYQSESECQNDVLSSWMFA